MEFSVQVLVRVLTKALLVLSLLIFTPPLTYASDHYRGVPVITAANTSKNTPLSEEMPIKFNLKANVKSIHAGGRVVFTATSNGNAEEVMLIDNGEGFGNIYKMQGKGRVFTYSLVLDRGFTGVMKYIVAGSTDITMASSNIVSLVVYPPKMNELSMLKISNRNELLYFVGQEFNLYTYGEFKGGAIYNLTESVLGTKYSSSNPAIASVSAEGKVTARSVGKATLTASNRGLKAFAYLEVVPKPVF